MSDTNRHDRTRAEGPPPRVIVSTGVGRLHFVETASALHHAGEHVELITGWIPSLRQRRLANLTGRLLGRGNLADRLAVRECAGVLPRSQIHSCGFAEGLSALARRFLQTNGQPWTSAQRAAWQAFGRSSRKFVRDADIFHVRSGAGQGGAIARARSLGMRVVADHSIAHPDFMAESLNPEFARYGLPAFAGSRDPFWNMVLQDCHDANEILVNSHFVAETFEARGFPAERIKTAYLGVRPDFFSLKSSYDVAAPVRLLFTGGFNVRKGAGYLIDALNMADPSRRRFALTVVGAAEEFERIRRFHPVSDRDTFIGPVLQDRLKAYLREADIYVFPTLSEGCAKSAMEALAAGVPVVTTRECGLPAVHDEHAYLVPSRNAEVLAAALDKLAADHGLRERLGRAGAAVVAARYTWDSYGTDVRRMHEALMHPQVPGPAVAAAVER